MTIFVPGMWDRDIFTDIPHIRLWVSKEPAILDDGDGSGIHERRQLFPSGSQTILGAVS